MLVFHANPASHGTEYKIDNFFIYACLLNFIFFHGLRDKVSWKALRESPPDAGHLVSSSFRFSLRSLCQRPLLKIRREKFIFTHCTTRRKGQSYQRVVKEARNVAKKHVAALKQFLNTLSALLFVRLFLESFVVCSRRICARGNTVMFFS